MKKVFLAMAIVVALSTASTAAIVYSQLSSIEYQTPQIPEKPQTPDSTLAVQQQELPKVIKDAIAKDYPGSTVKTSTFDINDKTYVIEIQQKEVKETTKVIYKETGEKVEKK